MNRTVIVIALIVVLLGGFALVQSQRQQPAQNTTTNTPAQPTAMERLEPTEASPAASGSAEETTGTVKEFTISGKNFAFSPSTMTVNEGDTVKITFKNTGGFHDFVIDEFDVATQQIQAGQEETVEFVADKAGTYEFYCSVGNHRAQGMKGTLTVK